MLSSVNMGGAMHFSNRNGKLSLKLTKPEQATVEKARQIIACVAHLPGKWEQPATAAADAISEFTESLAEVDA